MTMNLAETSRDSRIIAELREDAEARRQDPLYQSAPAFSFRDGSEMWFREFRFAQSERAIAADIVHEGAHLVGAPGDMLAELAIDAIHNAAGLRR